MMKRIKFILLIVFVSTGVSAQTTEDQLLTISAKKFEWMIRKQYDSLNAVLDENIRYIHSNGWIQNKKDVVDDFKSGKLLLKSVKVKEASVRFFDKSAIVIGTGNFSGVMDGNEFAMDLRYTEVYILGKDNHWKLASRHSNRLP